MSATLDAGPLAERLGAPVVRSEGRRFPVEIEKKTKLEAYLSIGRGRSLTASRARR